MSLVLASQSPRRAQLLNQLGVDFQQISADIDESVLVDESAKDYVVRLAVEKARVVGHKVHSHDWVLGSDTSVVTALQILGKPRDEKDFMAMMNQLSGSVHQVMTSIALVKQEQVLTKLVISDVTFTELTEQDMLRYWLSGEPKDKAGGYAIQGQGGAFITHLSGSYSGVVGLPLFETHQMLKQVGIA